MKKTFFIVFKRLSFGEKIKICQKIADTSFKWYWQLHEHARLSHDWDNGHTESGKYIIINVMSINKACEHDVNGKIHLMIHIVI